MQHSKNILLKWFLQRKRQLTSGFTPSGFTLLELLISIAISSIVVSGLLYLVVEIMQIDRQESSLDQVQRDMQRAINYIGDDLQEALYVYSDPERIATVLGGDPRFPDTPEDTPVLAFWRVDPIEIEDALPTVCVPGDDAYDSTAATFSNCEVLRVRQASYTLVVYVQRANDGNSNWPGQSRLIRYELSKYTDTSDLELRNGYRDPADLTDVDSSFEGWEPDLTTGVPAGTSAVLVDFVASPSTALNRSPLSDMNGATAQPCFSLGSDGSGNSFYQVVPSTATTTTNTSFFSCVRSSYAEGDNRANQDIYVFLRGNAYDGPSGNINMASEESALPILETRVLVKGIIDKSI